MSEHVPLTKEEREELRRATQIMRPSLLGQKVYVLLHDLDAKDAEIASLVESLILAKLQRDEARFRITQLENAWDPDGWISQRDEAREECAMFAKSWRTELAVGKRMEERIAKLEAVVAVARLVQSAQRRGDEEAELALETTLANALRALDGEPK